MDKFLECTGLGIGFMCTFLGFFGGIALICRAQKDGGKDEDNSQ